jgi:2'-5' RNA ligase
MAMPAVNLVNNSYFFSANSNPRFESYLDDKLVANRHPGSSINWWKPNAGHKLHCTLGFVFGQVNASAQQMTAINKTLKERTITHLKDYKTLPMKVTGFDVTKNGWVILKFQPKQQLNALHADFLQETQKQGLKASKFSGQNFMPHISIGTIKMGVPVQAALAELGQIFKQVQADPFPFMLFDISLNHVQGNQDHLLFQSHLKRREIGVISTDKTKGNTIIAINSQANAQKLAKELKEYYGIESSKTAGMEKTVKKVKTVFTLLLNPPEFKKVEGHYDNLT